MQHNGNNQFRPIVCRGVRGATTVTRNDKAEILEATRELLYILIRANGIHPDDVASGLFTTTIDLNTTYPALAARQLGWYDVALICSHELDIVNGLPMCIRVLLHWNTDKTPQEITHVYLRGALSLRKDRQSIPEIPVEEIEAAVQNFDLSGVGEISIPSVPVTALTINHSSGERP
ncbi:MAG TPA: chorismate mutase [Anaerolineae bacterium]|nr:chorismate mutase [Anaerolineae bacterium]